MSDASRTLQATPQTEPDSPSANQSRALIVELANGRTPRIREWLASPERRARQAAAALGLLVLLAIPFYLDAFWLQLGLFVLATAVAAIGLTLLLGQAGMLSLGHAFFVALGAYGYTYFASEGSADRVGLGLPPALSAVLAVALAGAAGLLFSPVAARLRGIYLGIASLGLVFVGQHVLVNAESLTGGVNGRDVPGFSLLGLPFEDVPGRTTYVLGVPFHREERLWYLAVAVLLTALVCYRLLVRSRTGRALRGIRDHEVASAAMGVDIVRYKAYAFLISSMYAGLGGVLLALAFRRVIPETFGMALSVEYLAIVVIGGLGSAGGAVFGAVFVASLPSVLERYMTQLQGSGAADAGGLTPAVLAKFVYGAALVLIVLLEPGGGAALARRLRRRRGRGGKPATAADSAP
ncbi:branched-chain amino acid ABC transporter permease [Streptomyces sp. FZ201]|uniref:branched-chain amino acid ABC transporter permease n=1 Tax=Streptomyces sp. FZ201 TaxID=3057122 RepID=UPI0021C00BD9|nr:branched-chain amino acid ABC transporter permease [Streptomyces sp. FZ201]